MRSKVRQQFLQHGKKMLAVLLAASMGISFPVSGALSEAAGSNGLSRQSVGENEVYGYGTMTMTYAEFYAGDVSNWELDAVSSATVQKSGTFPNADATEPTDDGYQIKGVKNVPVKVMASASDELKARVTLNEEGTAEPKQYKIVDGDGIGATVYDVRDTVTDAAATLSTNSVWGDYEIDIIEKSTSYLRNTRSDIKDEATGATFEIGSQIQGIILETAEGYKVATTHMENMWVQTYEVAFSLEGNANSREFQKLIGETISKVTFIMPKETYVYDLGEGVYIKPAYQNKVSGSFNAEGTKFTLDQEVSGLTNATISIIYKEGRKSTTLLAATALSGKEYTLTESLPEGKFATVTISSDEYADIAVEYPIMSWQSKQLEEMVSSAAAILEKLEDATLSSHKAEAEELLADTSATAEQANELIGELTSLIESATSDLAKATITKLSGTIDEAKKLVKDDYTESSWAEFETALSAAEAQLADPGTQAEVEEAVTLLQGAMTKLEKKTDNSVPEPPATSSNSTPSTTQTPSSTDDDAQAIKKKKVTIKSVAGQKKKMTVKWKKLSGADGYQIQYALNKKFKSAKVKSVKNVSKAVIKKLKAGKKYYVRICAYKKSGSSKVYSKYSAVKKVKVKK